MTAAQHADVRSMYPHGGRDRRVPRPLGWRAVFALVALAAAFPLLLWALTRPPVGGVLVAAAAVATGVRRRRRSPSPGDPPG